MLVSPSPCDAFIDTTVSPAPVLELDLFTYSSIVSPSLVTLGRVFRVAWETYWIPKVESWRFTIVDTVDFS